MNEIEFTESGMRFGPFLPDRCFLIEKCNAYRRIEDGVKIVDFVLLKRMKDGQEQIWLVEAKSSMAHPSSQEDFKKNINALRDKYRSSMELFIALHLGRHNCSSSRPPAEIQALPLVDANFKFVLVINEFKREWMPGLKDMLAKELRASIKTWALESLPVIVMNDEQAKSHGIVL